MNINDAFPSKYLSKTDLTDPETGAPRAFRLKMAYVEMTELDGERGKEVKPVLFFDRAEKGLVLNKGNAQVIEALYGSETTNWQGQGIEVYFDPTVRFGAKITGGIRVRAPNGGAAPAPAPAPAPQPEPAPLPGGVGEDDLDSDLPF